MSQFIIRGGKRLKGIIRCNGAKNAATPILAATILAPGQYNLTNIPQIEDVKRVLEILNSLGVQSEWTGEHKLKIISPEKILFKKLDNKIVKRLRSSTLFIGPLITKVTGFHFPRPGGCVIGSRPMDTHIKAIRDLGIEVEVDNDGYTFKRKGRIKCKKVVMSEFSPTATENLIMAAVSAGGTTTIKCAAAEYSVQDLCWFLNKMGAKISGIGTHTLIVEGVNKLHSANYQIVPDLIEAGTFMSLAYSTHSNIIVRNVAPEFMELELEKFREANCKFKIKNLKLNAAGAYKIGDIETFPSILAPIQPKLHNMPYPGFAPDMLPLFAVMMTQAHGKTLIHDCLYEDRLRYVKDLIRMGAKIKIADPHRIAVKGSTPLKGKRITSFDLRAGATLIVAALVATGKSVIDNIYQVDRGYEKLDARLQALGADIERVE